MKRLVDGVWLQQRRDAKDARLNAQADVFRTRLRLLGEIAQMEAEIEWKQATLAKLRAELAAVR